MSKNIKEIVKEKYNGIALQSKEQNQSSCCGGTSCCSEPDYTVFSDDYSGLEGYNPDADLGLGCGLPTEFAAIEPGNTVLDLGSGAGNDAFVARQFAGELGKVIGIDFAEMMLERSRENSRKLGFTNVEFIQGDIEDIPVKENSVDVVISNCVLNLVPEKQKAFAEIYRALKRGGHFCISDVVISGNLPEKLKQDAEMYAGCVSGALQKDEYLDIILKAGFRDIEIKKQKRVLIPDSILIKYLTREELDIFKKTGTGIFSITVTGSKN